MKKKQFLDSVSVQSPCSESWDEMIGNNEVRFCSHCAKNVHNISAMTRQQAEELIKNSSGKICVRYVKNPNGKLITAPPTLTKITRRATIAASVLATSLTLSTMAYSQGESIVKKDNSTQTQKDKSAKDEVKEGLATISGTVKDASDGLIPIAKVILRDTKSNKLQLTQTNENGFYEFKNVEPSIYELTIESLGFKKSVYQNIEVLKDSKLQKNIVLEVGEATIGVVDIVKEPNIEVEDIKIVDKPIEVRQIQELPLNNRKFTTMGLIMLEPPQKSKKEKKSKPKKKKN